MEQKRYSRQRELIYHYLCSTGAHPTAEMIFQALRPEHPKLSRGTVYRNLNQMAEGGLINKMPFQVERYDARTEPHAHFTCDRCGNVYDIATVEPAAELERLSADSGHAVLREERMYFGVCAACREAEMKQ